MQVSADIFVGVLSCGRSGPIVRRRATELVDLVGKVEYFDDYSGRARAACCAIAEKRTAWATAIVASSRYQESIRRVAASIWRTRSYCVGKLQG